MQSLIPAKSSSVAVRPCVPSEEGQAYTSRHIAPITS
jgi:hypothetical protein